jgi:hypothetical protein
MNSETLTKLSVSRLRDFANQYAHLVSMNRLQDAKLLTQDVYVLTQALDNGEMFLVLKDLRAVSARDGSDPS